MSQCREGKTFSSLKIEPLTPLSNICALYGAFNWTLVQQIFLPHLTEIAQLLVPSLDDRFGSNAADDLFPDGFRFPQPIHPALPPFKLRGIARSEEHTSELQSRE